MTLMSIVDFLATISISLALKTFRRSRYGPQVLRDLLAEFSVFVAIAAMAGFDHVSGVNTPKLNVPHAFKPTFEGRGWVSN